MFTWILFILLNCHNVLVDYQEKKQQKKNELTRFDKWQSYYFGPGSFQCVNCCCCRCRVGILYFPTNKQTNKKISCQFVENLIEWISILFGAYWLQKSDNNILCELFVAVFLFSLSLSLLSCCFSDLFVLFGLVCFCIEKKKQHKLQVNMRFVCIHCQRLCSTSV